MVKLAGRLGRQIIRQAPKYGAKFVLGVPCEVGIFFGSQFLIKKIKEKQNIEEEVIG
jgi:hypothetical protein